MVSFITLSHAYKGMRERTRKQAEGKDHPPLGSGGLPSSAIKVRAWKKWHMAHGRKE